VHPQYLQDTFSVDGILEKGVIKSSLGNFGHLPYGTTLKGRLHYPFEN
jgi:hypothetical protein